MIEENRTGIQTATGTGIAKVEEKPKKPNGNFWKGCVVARAAFGEKRRQCLACDTLGRPELYGVGKAAPNISSHF